jgi:hypothetical protein
MAAGAASGGVAADDVMRCGSGRLIDTGMSPAEVIARCGAPKSRSVEEVPVRRFAPTGASIPTGDLVRTERWTYERGQGQFPAVLTFESGELKRIELTTGR